MVDELGVASVALVLTSLQDHPGPSVPINSPPCVATGSQFTDHSNLKAGPPGLRAFLRGRLDGTPFLG